MTSDLSSVQLRPSFVYQTSPKLPSVSDQPPRTHKWSRYTTAENHSLGFQGAEAVTCFQFTPSSELQTSLVGMARGLRAPPPRTHSLLSNVVAIPFARFDQPASAVSPPQFLPPAEDQTSLRNVVSLF